MIFVWRLNFFFFFLCNLVWIIEKLNFCFPCIYFFFMNSNNIIYILSLIFFSIAPFFFPFLNYLSWRIVIVLFKKYYRGGWDKNTYNGLILVSTISRDQYKTVIEVFFFPTTLHSRFVKGNDGGVWYFFLLFYKELYIHLKKKK